jgi:hypothetical protein
MAVLINTVRHPEIDILNKDKAIQPVKIVKYHKIIKT